MKAKTSLILAAIISLLLVRSVDAQDLGPLFKKIKDGIYVYTGKPNESNCTIILTQEGVVLIDSGNNPTDSQAVMKAVKQLTSQPIRFLINTEPHTDHTTGILFSLRRQSLSLPLELGSRCGKLTTRNA